jgi:hypothetical protein
MEVEEDSGDDGRIGKALKPSLRNGANAATRRSLRFLAGDVSGLTTVLKLPSSLVQTPLWLSLLRDESFFQR